MYKVFHVAFGDAGKEVAVVDADNLDKVYEVTNSITGPWIENKEIIAYVLPPGREGIRSTSVDDVIYEVGTGKFFIVSDFGFTEIDENTEGKVAIIIEGEWAPMPYSLLVKALKAQIN